MTVTYRNNASDVWHTLVYLATRTVFGRLFLALMLICPFASPALIFFNTPPGSKAEHIAVITFLPMIGATIAILAFSIFIGVYLGKLISPHMTATLEPEYCCVTVVMFSRTRKGKIPWRNFQRMSEERDFFCFFGWRSQVFIPKLAFASRAEADRLFHTALTYWYDAKGTVPPPPPAPPDLTGVWPPAPQTPDLQEPGAAAKH